MDVALEAEVFGDDATAWEELPLAVPADARFVHGVVSRGAAPRPRPPPEDLAPAFRPREADERVDLTFRNLGLRLASARVLGGVAAPRERRAHGRARPVRRGKSTFLALLAGRRLGSGWRTGSVRVNGRRGGVERWCADRSAFVHQADALKARLTVWETLYFSSCLRLPAAHRRRRDLVEDVLEALDLSRRKHALLGDGAAARGVSGGQRRRVSVGVELVAEPSLLFLDEPTSGLDSATALRLARTLHALAAQKNVAVVAVLHAPSSAAFALFDRLLLLGRGGTAFEGKPGDALPYLRSVRPIDASHANPADAVVAVVAGDDKLARYAVERSRRLGELFSDCVVEALAGALVASTYSEYAFGDLPSMNFMTSLGLVFTVALAALPCFGGERSGLDREASPAGADLDLAAYFLAVDLVELPRLALLTAAFLSVYYPLTAPLTRPVVFFGVCAACAYAAAGVGYLASTVFLRESKAQLAATVFVLVASMFAGVVPTLDDLASMSPLLVGLPWASPNRWLCEALYVLQARHFSDAWKMPVTFIDDPNRHSALAGLHAFHYADDGLVLDVALLLVIGVALRLGALGALLGLHRERRDRASLPKALCLAGVVAPLARAVDALGRTPALALAVFGVFCMVAAGLVVSSAWW
ncbi:sulfuric ester hydrolase [Aureococcus anophagefferens]|nr:sulfuric ester hydrolase [Aureococcus anophagefferens]